MARRGAATGALVSLPFTLAVVLLCTTAGADGVLAPVASLGMLAVLLAPTVLQVGCGMRSVRGEPLLRPLASVTLGYLGGAFAVLLAGDALVRVSGVKGGALPAGLGAAASEWAAVLLGMASVPALSGLVVVVGVVAFRSRIRTG